MAKTEIEANGKENGNCIILSENVSKEWKEKKRKEKLTIYSNFGR